MVLCFETELWCFWRETWKSDAWKSPFDALKRKYKSCVAAHRKYLAFNTSCLFNHSDRKLTESFEHHGQHSVCVSSMVHLCRFKSGCTSYWSSDEIYQILLLFMYLGLKSYNKALFVQRVATSRISGADRHNVRNRPLVHKEKVLLPSLHVNLGVFIQFVKALKLEEGNSIMKYLQKKIPSSLWGENQGRRFCWSTNLQTGCDWRALRNTNWCPTSCMELLQGDLLWIPRKTPCSKLKR